MAWLGLASACDPLAAADYEGEVIGRLRGQITVRPGVPVPDSADIGLVWKNDGLFTMAQLALVKMRVAAQFPAQFEVALRYLPPKGTYTVRLAVAEVFAFKAGSVQNEGLIETRPGRLPALFDNVIGALVDTFIVYLDKTIAVDQPQSIMLGGAHTRGFHVLSLDDAMPEDEKERQRAACRVFIGEPENPLCNMASGFRVRSPDETVILEIHREPGPIEP